MKMSNVATWNSPSSSKKRNKNESSWIIANHFLLFSFPSCHPSASPSLCGDDGHTPSVVTPGSSTRNYSQLLCFRGWNPNLRFKNKEISQSPRSSREPDVIKWKGDIFIFLNFKLLFSTNKWLEKGTLSFFFLNVLRSSWFKKTM